MTETMLILGFMAHHLTVLTDLKLVKGKDIGFSWYVKERPIKLVLSLIGAIVGYITLDHYGELSVVTSFGVGFISDSVTDRLGKIASSKL